MTDTEPVVKYAMELSGLDIGKRVTWIHKYKYKGQQREKIREVARVMAVEQTGTKTNIWFKDHHELGYWASTTDYYWPAKADELVAVYE